MLPPLFEGELDENCAERRRWRKDSNGGWGWGVAAVGGTNRGERPHDKAMAADVQPRRDNDGVIAGGRSSAFQTSVHQDPRPEKVAKEKGRKSFH